MRWSGGTVEILPTPAGCKLHWYDDPWRPQALVAAAFTRLYFEGRFLATLEGNITTNETANAEAEQYRSK